LIDGIVERALAEAGVPLDALDAVAATAGPGLIGGVMVGLTTGKAFALAADKPLVAVNHLEAHALSARLTDGVALPFLLLLISGGHCQLMAVEAPGRFRLYGTTIDDAVGEALDKAAKLLGLAYPGGPAIEALARKGDPRRYTLLRFFAVGPEDRVAPDRAQSAGRCRSRKLGGELSGRHCRYLGGSHPRRHAALRQ